MYSPTYFKLPSKKFQVCLNIPVKLKNWTIMPLIFALWVVPCHEPEMAVTLTGFWSTVDKVPVGVLCCKECSWLSVRFMFKCFCNCLLPLGRYLLASGFYFYLCLRSKVAFNLLKIVFFFLRVLCAYYYGNAL